MRQIDIADFPFQETFEGYLWYSDARKPQVYIRESIPADAFGLLPFVVEGVLYAPDSEQSFHIRCVDGRYIITAYALDDYPQEQLVEMQHLPVSALQAHGISALRLLELWLPQAAGHCMPEGFEVLQPAAHIFSGFDYEKR